ncbi:hypothetical protein SDC9_92836 [bioreactor metagenome]|uniref:Uncharacterized protein n=1 Tax=bioreactor metagenome TaxID=1076179 RepID=A0A645A099_9ZZZZ
MNNIRVVPIPKNIISIVDSFTISNTPCISPFTLLSDIIFEIATGTPDAIATKNMYNGYDI